MEKRSTPLTKNLVSASLIFALILSVASVIIYNLLGRELAEESGNIIAKYTIVQIVTILFFSLCFMFFFSRVIKNHGEENDKKEADLNTLSMRDELTGIRNKLGFADEIRRLQERIEAGDTEFAIALCDLNFLDTINDKYGTDKGDVAIKKLCHLICVTFEHSPVFRIIGGEFAIVLTGQDLHNYDVLADTLIEEMQDAFFDDRLEPWERISAAIAAVTYDPKRHNDIDLVYKDAEEKMFEKKRSMKGTE